MLRRQKQSIAAAMVAAVLSVALVGCGGGGSKSSRAKSATVAGITSSTTSQAGSTSSHTPAHKAKPHKPNHSASKTHTTSTASHTSTASPAHTGSPAAPPASGAGVHHTPASHSPTGPLQVTLTAPNHDPTANQKWPYSISVRDGRGQPLNGTVDVEFALGGKVVGRATPPTDPIKGGKWQDKLTYPSAAVGIPLVFRLVVHTVVGTKTIDWPVKVHR